MTANIEITPDNDLKAIAIEAGQPDSDKRLYKDGKLYVKGVTQESLDTAALKKDEFKTAMVERKSDYRLTLQSLKKCIKQIVMDKYAPAERAMLPAKMKKFLQD